MTFHFEDLLLPLKKPCVNMKKATAMQWLFCTQEKKV